MKHCYEGGGVDKPRFPNVPVRSFGRRGGAADLLFPATKEGAWPGASESPATPTVAPFIVASFTVLLLAASLSAVAFSTASSVALVTTASSADSLSAAAAIVAAASGLPLTGAASGLPHLMKVAAAASAEARPRRMIPHHRQE
jgi:hypothetical protein